MDLTDFAFELEGAPEVPVYPTARALAERRAVCLFECGIVEVEVRVVRVLLSPREPDRGDSSDECGTARMAPVRAERAG